MILINISKLGISWENTDISYNCANPSECAEYNKNIMELDINKLVASIESSINLIESIENALRQEVLKFSINGEDITDNFDLFIYKENLGQDKSTALFYEFLISRKEREVESLSRLINRANLKSISITWDDSSINLVNHKWHINSGYKLSDYMAVEWHC